MLRLRQNPARLAIQSFLRPGFIWMKNDNSPHWMRRVCYAWVGADWWKRHRQRSTAGSWLCWLKYVMRTSMNTWIISSIITIYGRKYVRKHGVILAARGDGLGAFFFSLDSVDLQFRAQYQMTRLQAPRQRHYDHQQLTCSGALVWIRWRCPPRPHPISLSSRHTLSATPQ